MANLKEKLFGLIDNGTLVTKSLIDTVNETINSIDWDAQFNSLKDMKDSLLERGNELMGEFNELMKQVKNNITDFEVVVPFDESIGEKFESKIEDGKLIIEVSFEDENSERSNKTTVKIPENCDVEKMTKKYNAVNKTMTVIIPKVIIESATEEETKPKGYKLKTAATTPRKKVVFKPKEEESHQAESKLLKRFRENSRQARVVNRQTTEGGIPRGANGRFMKRTPTN